MKHARIHLITARPFSQESVGRSIVLNICINTKASITPNSSEVPQILIDKLFKSLILNLNLKCLVKERFHVAILPSVSQTSEHQSLGDGILWTNKQMILQNTLQDIIVLHD